MLRLLTRTHWSQTFCVRSNASRPACRWSRYWTGWPATRSATCFNSLKSLSDRESRRRRSLFHHVQLDLRDTSSGNSKRLGSGRRDVDDTSRDERTAVIDPNGHRSPGGDVGDTHLGTERQSAVSGGHLLRIEFFAARRPRLMPIKTGKTIRAAGRLGCLFIGRFARRGSAFLRDDGHSSVVFE